MVEKRIKKSLLVVQPHLSGFSLGGDGFGSNLHLLDGGRALSDEENTSECRKSACMAQRTTSYSCSVKKKIYWSGN